MAGEHYLEFLHPTTGARLGITTGSTGNIPTGVSQSEVFSNGFTRLIVNKTQNSPGLIQFDIPHDHPLLPFLDKTQVIDWRRDEAFGIDWYRHQVGFIRDSTYTSTHGNQDQTISAVGMNDILRWYIIAWDAAVANRTVFTAAKAETIMKTLVARNAIASTATVAAGRDRQGADYGISNEADSARGNTIDWTANRSHTLLEELQALALIGGGDFELTYLTSTTRQFVWKALVDKSATVIFSEILDNMDNIRFRRNRGQESTAAIVGGRGENDDRDIVVRTGTNYSATNDIEMFVNATDIEYGATAQLQARGDAKLREVESRDEFTFDVLQTQGTAYKRDYVEGDLVSAVKPDGTRVTQQIWGTIINWQPGNIEEIKVEVRTR